MSTGACGVSPLLALYQQETLYLESEIESIFKVTYLGPLTH